LAARILAADGAGAPVAGALAKEVIDVGIP
jgi:hypothetical protein